MDRNTDWRLILANFKEIMVSKYGFPDFCYLERTKNVPNRSMGINDAEFIVRPNQDYLAVEPPKDSMVHPAYEAWHTMLSRCGAAYQAKKPSYLGVSCCRDWLYFSNFAVWFKDKYREGFTLDKDLIERNNKIYSPKTCLYVPPSINSFLTTSAKVRGNYPQSVTKAAAQSKFRARINNGEVRQHLGYFNSAEEAHRAWQKAKIRKAYELMSEFNIPQLKLIILRIEEDISNNIFTESL